MEYKGRIRLSHSAINTLTVCERKFQLDRLLTSVPNDSTYAPLVFGKAWGAGIASYLEFQDINKAILTLWLAYYPAHEEDTRRTEDICIHLLLAAIPKLDTLLLDWEPANFEGKPAAEMSFKLDIDDKFYYVGYIDFIAKNKWSGRYGIIEVKTTALNLFDLDPIYQNSGQGVGYSIALDKIAGSEQTEYDLIYIVGQLGSGDGFTPLIHIKTYQKNIQDRFNWFISLGMDVDRIRRMLDINVFPLRGGNCLQYNKPCYHFGSCTLYDLDRYKEEVEDVIDYQFVYNLDEIISDHIERTI